MNTNPRGIRVAVVGMGNVGATFAYALLLSGLAAEIVLIDANKAKAEGEAMDLNHTLPFTHSTRIWAGDYSDCAGAEVTVITAGSARKPGETRLDLLKKNIGILQSIVPQVVKHNPEGIILVATNPVDVLTYATLKISGLAEHRVIGSGTILDTARFRYLLGQHFTVDPRSVHTYIIGEHGDSAVPLWSMANIGGLSLHDFRAAEGLPDDPQALENIFIQTRDVAPHVIKRKGATYYAVAAGLMRIVEAILRNQRTVLSVSTLVHDYYGVNDVCFSLPTVIKHSGVDRVLRLQLDEREIEGIKNSAQVLKASIAEIRDLLPA